ncbi:hypothetical protein RJ641_027410, partial [Dillenia turbinata]
PAAVTLKLSNLRDSDLDVFVLLHQLQIFSLGRSLPDQPPVNPPIDVPENSRAKSAGLDAIDPKPGTELKLVDAVPCRIAFERGRERHFCFLALSVGIYGWIILAEELPLKQCSGVIRVVAPLAGCNKFKTKQAPVTVLGQLFKEHKNHESTATIIVIFLGCTFGNPRPSTSNHTVVSVVQGRNLEVELDFGRECMVWRALAMPKIDDKHARWLHLRIRPSTLPSVDPAKSAVYIKSKAKALVDGRWTLAFRDEESCRLALSMVLEESSLQSFEVEKMLKPLLDLEKTVD